MLLPGRPLELHRLEVVLGGRVLSARDNDRGLEEVAELAEGAALIVEVDGLGVGGGGLLRDAEVRTPGGGGHGWYGGGRLCGDVHWEEEREE